MEDTTRMGYRLITTPFPNNPGHLEVTISASDASGIAVFMSEKLF